MRVLFEVLRSLRLVAPAVLLLAGCGGAGGEKLAPVAGKVTVNGSPLSAGSVTFHPDAAKGNSTPHIPVGTLNADGQYTLKSATQDGAPRGWYKVTVTAQEPIDPKNPYAPPKHLIDPKFSNAATSGLTIEVLDKPQPGAYDLILTR